MAEVDMIFMTFEVDRAGVGLRVAQATAFALQLGSLRPEIQHELQFSLKQFLHFLSKYRMKLRMKECF